MHTSSSSFTPILNWIDAQQGSLTFLLKEWASINSGSDNLPGLARMLAALESRFSQLGASMELIDLAPRISLAENGDSISLPHGQALRLTKRPEAPIKVFLGGHMDTVYAPTHAFQSVEQLDSNTLRGPGVADMKGGLIVLLTALQAFEKHPSAKHLGWEVLINPDEEIGSIGSEPLFISAAKRNHLGLIFEPSFADGALVSSRKGSGNFTVVARGRPAHAGRDFHHGRNAIAPLAAFIVAANALSNLDKGITVNVGQVVGGGPVNVVPELAICRLNVRATAQEDFEETQQKLRTIASEIKIEGVTLSFHQHQARNPKPFDAGCRRLFDQLNACANEEPLFARFVHENGQVPRTASS